MNIGPNDLLREFLKIAAGKPSIAFNFALLSSASILLISTFLASIKWPIPIIQFSLPSFSLNLPSPISIFIFALFLVYSFFEFHWKRRFLPPGPIPLWIAGNMPQVFLHGPRNIDGLLQQWKAKYGGIFTFWMGPIPMVMVSDVELLRRYFLRNGDVFSGRWQNFITHTFMDGHNGVIQIQGDKWREQRRFSLHVLRDFGVGRTMMEEKIKVEVKALIQHLEGKFGENEPKTEEMDICKPIAVCIANIINNILFGRTYAHDDPSIIRVQQMLDRQSILVVQPWMGLYLTLPWTTKIPLIDSAWRELLTIRNDFWAFLEGHIQEHVHKFNPNLEPTDFTFSYLAEINRRKREMANEDDHYFSKKQLKMLLLDLFFAGSETTVTTTKWGILLLILHPEVQERCYQELAQKIGKREPELKDRSQLTYLNATICEIQRLANILPINLLRTCLENVQIDGFKFAQGTMVLPQISITMNDPIYFPEPQKFNPDRFIDEKTGNLKRIDAFLPFSIGKRQCLGESLARAELFFIFAYLIRHFQFLPENAQKLPSTKRIYGLTCSPQPFKCRLIRRIINKNAQNSRANA